MVSAARNSAQTLWTMVHRIKRSHVGQQRLRGTDVGGRFFTANVLLTGLHCHT
ncbi:Uncharacterised protein [Vibrio cholerae]|nr:Uncharacterised protein [Vibrio cholerae]